MLMTLHIFEYKKCISD